MGCYRVFESSLSRIHVLEQYLSWDVDAMITSGPKAKDTLD